MSKARGPVTQAVDKVRTAVADAARGLSDADYVAFFEELLADADGWKMDLQERAADEAVDDD